MGKGMRVGTIVVVTVSDIRGRVTWQSVNA